MCQKQRVLLGGLTAAIMTLLFFQDKFAIKLLQYKSTMAPRYQLNQSAFNNLQLLSLSETTRTVKFGTKNGEDLAPRAGTIEFKNTNSTLLAARKDKNTQNDRLMEKEEKGEEMDPRVQYYMKFIEEAPLNPQSIEARNLNWEGYNFSRQFKLPAEIVDELDANKIPLHYQANVDQILNENFGSTDVDEILHKIKLKKD